MPIDLGPIAPVRPVRTTPFADTAKRQPAPLAEAALVNDAPAIPPQPPVDAERVAQIRHAIADGSYPLLPARIADAMIAAGLRLSLGE